ncbi:hypothetical protein HG530_010141 [Fusarium avenaceum]|nr:hypothetical protein HG530_010141 [Fusarium avenaceum]
MRSLVILPFGLSHAHLLLGPLLSLVQGERSTELLVLLDISQELLVLLIHAFLVGLLGQKLALVLAHALELPVSLALLRRLDLDGDHGVEKVDKLLGLVPLGEEKVDTILGLPDVEGVLVCAVLHDELLEEQESSLVEDLLADLNSSSPDVGSVRLGTLRALLVRHHVYDLETLLEQHAILDRVLDGDLDLDSSRMGFSPDEMCVHETDFVHASKFLEA